MEPLVVSDPNVMMGKPVVAGTRITVELILEELGAGETMEDPLEAPPRFSRECEVGVNLVGRGERPWAASSAGRIVRPDGSMRRSCSRVC